ncbi:MAG TPA: endolytic transglycosylase MltG [Candidatus Rubrimentiphilum sp.]|nr:endolytic transglycosylase MltG [Candidatus Rubrimentiphilum sp.]
MRRVLSTLALLIVLAVAIGGAWIAYALFGDRSHPATTTGVVIAQGSTFADIATQLQTAGVIGSAELFRVYAKASRTDTQARAGEFRFAPHQTQAEVLRQLQTGGAQIAKWITIPEGFTAKQIAAQLASEGFGDAANYEQAFMHDTIVLDGFRTRNMEGYLFPDTYLMPVGASSATVEAIMSAQFRKEFPADAARKARLRGLTVPQIVTLASLIEREAKADDERPLMAGVYYNRLRLGMPLEVDATIEYALPQHETVITYSDLKLDSPYNTYLHQGLPPTPIANPGRPSLIAALNPRPSDFLYYVYKGHGHHAFAKTLAEQNANAAKYLK